MIQTASASGSRLSLSSCIVLAVAAVACLAPAPVEAEQASSHARAFQAGRIDSGGSHTCAVLSNGTVRCWGQGEYGQLGYGNTEYIGDDESPEATGAVDLGNHSAISVAVGELHSCALLDNGSVRCWGYGGDGELGYGNTEAIGDDEAPSSVGTVNLGVGRSAVAITAGIYHTCALLDNGTVRCWGYNGEGQLGYGNMQNIGDNETPGAAGPVNLGTGRSAVSIMAGAYHTCAVLDNGTVRCWGYGGYGALGYASTDNIGDNESPGAVGPVGLGRNAVALAAGEKHTCAILDNGTVRCWGWNGEGALGYGVPGLSIGDNEAPSAAGPVNLAGRSAVSIMAGMNHTCAVLDNGTVRCWGNGEYGQLGYGNTQTIGDNETPAAVPAVTVGRSAVAITGGVYHTCALLDNGTVRCWGYGGEGQLGYGDTESIGDNEAPSAAGPVQLDSETTVGRYAVEISSEGSHTCAILDNGTVRCWGHPSEGQLGYGNGTLTVVGDNETPGSMPPIDLGAGRTAVSIAAGRTQTCAILDNGTVRCWGAGDKGQLGYGNTADIGDNETPGSVGPVNLGGRNAIALAAGDEHTCAILDDGTVRCWGRANFGQLGYGNENNIGDNELPSSVGTVDIGAGRTAISISAGDSHTCVILDNGTVRCWGFGGNGALGYGKNTAVGDNELPSTAGPVDLGTGRNAVEITTGLNHTCARLENGTMRCWGQGAFGQLGYGTTTTIGDNEVPGSVPTLDLGGHNARSVSGYSHHSCAIHEDGGMRCWGYNGDGELGYGHTEHIGDTEPANSVGTINIGAGRYALSVTGGTNHTCALLDNGTVRCWGEASAGQLGYGNTIDIGDNETPGGFGPVDFYDDIATAADDTKTLDEDSAATAIDVLANDVDPDGGAAKTITSNTAASHGSVAITGGGTGLTYAPAANYCGADSFSYTITGGTTATVSITVTCVDDPPTAANDLATVGEDSGATAVNVLANDTDSDSGPKLVSSVSQPAHGTVAITGGGTGLTYAPVADYCNDPPGGSPDTFTYTLNGGSSATVSITVTCVDDAPVAEGDSKTVSEDSAANAIDVLANDTDIDGGTKAIASKTDPEHGTVAITGGGTGLTYQPTANYCGADSFTYTLNGGSSATVSITVTCVDDPPTAVNDSTAVGEDSGATAIDVLTNDADIDAGPISIVSKTNGAHGSVVIIAAGGGITYQPTANYCGSDSFTYTLNGGSSATVSVDVTCVDDLPNAINDSKTLDEDSGATAIDVLANDTDSDGGTKLVVSKANGAHGAVAITGGGSGLTYTPDPNYCGFDSFDYSLNGGSGATVSITVTCVDDPPAAVNDAKTVNEDSGATAIDVFANDTDVDNGTKLIASVTDPSHGTAAITGGGTGVTYQPAANYCNDPPGGSPDTFTYTLNGGSSATVSVTVTCVDDAPLAVNDSKTVNEDSGATAIDVLANDTDSDGGAKSIASSAAASHGSVAITGGGTGLTYAPAANYCGADSFTYTLNGGSTATVSITVTCVDDPPAAVNDSKTVNEDASPTAIDVLANDTDVDGGTKLVVSLTQPSHGTAAITGGGTELSYVPAANYCGADSFTYTLSGGASATVSISVTCLDDTPVAVDDSDTVIEDSGANAIDVLANDSDIDGGPKAVNGKTNGSNGAVAILGGGAGLTYQPAPDYCGPDSFTYTLNGGSTATVSVTVTCVEDQPPPEGGGGGGGGGQQTPTIVQTNTPTSTAPVINVTPGVGVVSGRRHPRIAVKGSYAFFTLTCKVKEGECVGTVTITATIPSLTLGPTTDKVSLVKGKFRIGAGRSVLVRAKLTKRGRQLIEERKTLRGIASHMSVVDTSNGEQGEIDVNLVRRPKASLLGSTGSKSTKSDR